MVISVSHLKKHYQVFKKESGFMGSIKSLVHRKYESVPAVNDISFDILEGELVGFIGPNGAGKTTTLKCLSGLLYPTSGSISVLGFTPQHRRPEFQKQFSLVMGQKNQLWWDLPPLESFRLQQAIYDIPLSDYHQTLSQLVQLLGIDPILTTPVRKLSLGERMKCELVAALLHQPQVLFLDEPTIGLDVVMQKVIRDFILDYNRRFKATILLTSHYMEDVKYLCQRVIVINRGRILFDGQLSEVVNRYSRNKILRLVFSQDFDQRRLAEQGKVVAYHFPQAVITVPKDQAVAVATRLLHQFPVADLTIEEPPIEAVIRDFFDKEDNHAT